MLFYNYSLWGRTIAQPYDPTCPVAYVTKEPACLRNYDVKMILLSIEDNTPKNLFTKLLRIRSAIIHVQITNLSTEPFSPFRGKGAVNISYQWVKENGSRIVKDGAEI